MPENIGNLEGGRLETLSAARKDGGDLISAIAVLILLSLYNRYTIRSLLKLELLDLFLKQPNLVEKFGTDCGRLFTAGRVTLNNH